MSKEIFNLEFLVSIHIIEKRSCFYFNYKEARTNFFGRKIKGGYYKICDSDSIIWEPDSCGLVNHDGIIYIIEHNVVYYRPHVELKFADGNNKIVRFSTYDEALDYGTRISNEHIKSPLIFKS